MGQPGSSNRLGTSSSEAPDLLVHSEVDSGPGGVPAPKWSPTLWSDLVTLGWWGWRLPYCPTFGQPPSRLAAPVKEPKQTSSFGKKTYIASKRAIHAPPLSHGGGEAKV